MSKIVTVKFHEGASVRFPDQCIYCGRPRAHTISYPISGTSSYQLGPAFLGKARFAVSTASSTLEVPYCEEHYWQARRARALLKAARIAGVPVAAALGYGLAFIPFLLRGVPITSSCIWGALIFAVVAGVLFSGLVEWLVRLVVSQLSEALATTPRFRSYASGSPGSYVPYPFGGLLGVRIGVQGAYEIEFEFANDDIADVFAGLN